MEALTIRSVAPALEEVTMTASLLVTARPPACSVQQEWGTLCQVQQWLYPPSMFLIIYNFLPQDYFLPEFQGNLDIDDKTIAEMEQRYEPEIKTFDLWSTL